MRFLCVCRGGNVRSAALAYILHDHFGQEAIPVGVDRVSTETVSYFAEWADLIVCMQEVFVAHIPEQFHDKVRILEVGEDRWGITLHPELLKNLKPVVKGWSERGFRI